jgi:hypothetical protein
MARPIIGSNCTTNNDHFFYKDRESIAGSVAKVAKTKPAYAFFSLIFHCDPNKGLAYCPASRFARPLLPEKVSSTSTTHESRSRQDESWHDAAYADKAKPYDNFQGQVSASAKVKGSPVSHDL